MTRLVHEPVVPELVKAVRIQTLWRFPKEVPDESATATDLAPLRGA